MANRPTRAEVPVEQTWNLADIYPSSEAWEHDLAALEGAVEVATAYQGRFGEGPGVVLSCLRAVDDVLRIAVKVGAFARLAVAVDGSDARAQAQSARAGASAARIEASLSFVRSELVALPEGTLERYLEDEPELGLFRPQLEDAIRARPHVLHPETERVLAALGETLEVPFAVWQRATSVDVVCPPIRDQAGAEMAVSVAGWQFGLRHHPDRSVRQSAYESVYAGLGAHRATLATTLAAHLKKNVTLARLRGFASAAEMILAPQRIPVAVYRQVMDEVHDGMAPHVRRLMELRRRLLGIDQLRMWDVDAPLDSSFDPPTSFAEAETLIRQGLSRLGPEYDQIVAAAFRDRWIERADNLGKRSGAFCATVYGVHSYVFTTWQDKLRSAMVVAHELGHAGHGMLASRNQIVSNTRAGLFFIEAPSTANEMLVGQNLLASSADPRLRRFIVLEFLGTFLHNMVTHMLEAHFERRLYDLAEADRPLTLNVILDTQAEVYERFYGGTVAVDDLARLYWTQQPHFYVNLYPYTYAAGLACGTAVAEAIRRDGQPAVDRWLATLRLGGRLPPLELAQHAGVDMASPEPLRAAVAYFGSLVDELESSFAPAGTGSVVRG